MEDMTGLDFALLIPPFLEPMHPHPTPPRWHPTPGAIDHYHNPVSTARPAGKYVERPGVEIEMRGVNPFRGL